MRLLPRTIQSEGFPGLHNRAKYPRDGIFKKSMGAIGTEEELGDRTGPPGYIGWRNSFLGINSEAP
jgi:hypothetical protein